MVSLFNAQILAEKLGSGVFLLAQQRLAFRDELIERLFRFVIGVLISFEQQEARSVYWQPVLDLQNNKIIIADRSDG